jgi:sugar phosphate isomerase/epimerase
MIWGYALVWYGPFLKEDPDPLWARLKFLRKHGLKVTGIGLREFTALPEAKQQEVAQFLAEHDMQLTPGVGFDYLNSDADAATRKADEVLASLARCGPLLRNTIVHTGACTPEHRFDRTRPLEEKLDRLSRGMAPLAAGCQELGTPLCIENHGDYYCSDLVELCRRTPGLTIFLDTGNTYLIGERPWPAFVEAAPYTVGTHFKDHRVCPRPEARPLHFEVDGSPLGDGDVPLRECYDLLRQQAPNPDKLVMEIEMICPDSMDPNECLDRSLTFIRGLEAGS